jgi:16S rRNA (cytosine1402-N4)-methyltransferase
MTDADSPKPPRRIRYSGTHPRRFEEKYKEHQPERYEADVEKVVASGKTPAGMHRPIMVREILKILALQPGEIAVDCTLGYGGHAKELLKAVQPGGRLIALDADPLELPKAEARLRELGFPGESLVVRRMNYAGLPQLLAELSPDGVDAILADLGLSSMQIDDPARGFTFKHDGPLDMRMNPSRGHSAASLLAKIDQKELARLLGENADEPNATQISKAILAAQHDRPLTTTRELADVVRDAASRGRGSRSNGDDTVRRVFQALRIEVNDEFGALDTFLRQLSDGLKSGGRVAIMTFHSGEDRRVKHAFRDGLRNGVYSSVSLDVIRPTPAEQRANPRSSPAKLRFAVKR